MPHPGDSDSTRLFSMFPFFLFFMCTQVHVPLLNAKTPDTSTISSPFMKSVGEHLPSLQKEVCIETMEYYSAIKRMK